MSIRLNHDTGLIQVTDSDRPLSVTALGIKLPVLPDVPTSAQQHPGTIFFNTAVGCPSYISNGNQVMNLDLSNLQLKSDLMAGASDGEALYYQGGGLVWKELSADSLFPADGVVEMRPNMRFKRSIIVETETDNSSDDNVAHAEKWYDTDNDDEWEQLQLKIKHPSNGIAGISFQQGTQTGVAIYHNTSGSLKFDCQNAYFGGEVTFHNGTVSQGSDIKLKKDVKILEPALAKLRKLNSYTFKYKTSPEKTHIGFIAQELEHEYPELVSEDSNGTKAVAYSEMTAVLMQAIKELDAEVKQLRKPWWKRLLGL